MRERVFRSALGLSVGDIVKVLQTPWSSESRPYEIWDIRGPYYIENGCLELTIRTWPVISMRCVRPGNQSPREVFGDDGFSYLNHIRREGDRWFSDQNCEIVVLERRPVVQMNLFDDVAPEPYQFQLGVDYAAGVGRVWKCQRCGLDFNAVPEERHGPAWHCGDVAIRLVVMPPRAMLRGPSA